MANSTTVSTLTKGTWTQISDAGEQALITMSPEADRSESDRSTVLLKFAAAKPTTEIGHIFLNTGNNQNFVVGSANTDKAWLFSVDRDSVVSVTKL